jgi:hypothetical protein
MPCSVCCNMQLFEGWRDTGTNMLAMQLAQPSRRVQCIRVNKELQRLTKQHQAQQPANPVPDMRWATWSRSTSTLLSTDYLPVRHPARYHGDSTRHCVYMFPVFFLLRATRQPFPAGWECAPVGFSRRKKAHTHAMVVSSRSKDVLLSRQTQPLRILR